MLSHETSATPSATAAVDSPHPLRVLVTKIGFDGHDRGSRLVAAFLRDAGHEVVYTPPWQEISGVVTLAMQEDVDVIGVSSLATDHLIVPELMAALGEAGLDHVKVVVGGIVPDHEVPDLTAAGVARIFGPGSSREDIVDGVEAIGRIAQEHKRARGGFES
ncbi:MAG: cobalamin-dependent protein [Actinomycetota bacterium]